MSGGISSSAFRNSKITKTKAAQVRRVSGLFLARFWLRLRMSVTSQGLNRVSVSGWVYARTLIPLGSAF